MSASVRPPRMTAEEFIAWAMQQPEGTRYELEEGDVISMAPERVAHARVKFQVAFLLRNAIAAAGLPCEVFVDGPAVRIDETTVYQPDALLRCGARLAGEVVVVPDPLLAVEVGSPSTFFRDSVDKLSGYFGLPSLHHYLQVHPERPLAIHHQRNGDGPILTRIIRDGRVRFDPPGIEIAGMFEG